MTIQMVTNSESGNAGVDVRHDRAVYLANLLQQRQPVVGNNTELQAIRNRALSVAHELAIPSTRDEEWRFTPLSALLETPFQAAPTTLVSMADIEPFILPEAEIRLVMVDGVVVPTLCQGLVVSDHLVVGDVTVLPSHHPVFSHIAMQSGSEEAFTALNTACLQSVGVVWVAAQGSIVAPIHLLSLSTGREVPTVSYPRWLVMAEPGSSVTIVEDYGCLGDQRHFTNAVTELWVGAHARVSHTRVQRDGQTAIHIGKTAVSQAQDAHYTCYAINLGSRLSRHNLNVTLTGEQTSTTLEGLTVIEGEQLADTHSAIVFTKPHGTSQQIHKCIVGDRAHAVFNGKVVVPKAAQLTDASQLSRTLLLSPQARVDTKPQLEITADNVKCSHGATVSQLDADEIFYLQSRGLDQSTAAKLLIYAFAAEVVDHIPVRSLAATLTQHIRQHSHL